MRHFDGMQFNVSNLRDTSRLTKPAPPRLWPMETHLESYHV